MKKLRLAILISGGGSNMVSLLRSIGPDHPCEAALVLSNSPDAGGLPKARDLGVVVDVVDHRNFASRESFDAALNARLEQADVDLVCLAGFMRIVSPVFVQRWAGRCLNIHPSLLPEFKGLNTHARAIEAGQAEHGCTVHEVTAELDDGPILGQARVPVLADDTPDTLAARVLVKEHLLYPAVLREFALNGRDCAPVSL